MKKILFFIILLTIIFYGIFSNYKTKLQNNYKNILNSPNSSISTIKK